MKHLLNSLALVLVGVLTVPIALAQEKLGPVLDRNPTKLDRDDVRLLLAGTKIVFTSTNPFVNAYVENNWDLGADGSISALQMRHAGPIRGTGKWHVRDDGKWCIDIDWPRANQSVCYWFFKVGDEYWTASSDRDRDAVAIRRKITRRS